MPTILPLLSNALEKNKLSLSDSKKQKLVAYLTLLKTWNTRFNLTTILDPRDMVYLHLVDSLVMQPFLQGTRLLDVGSGGGLPGIPLAIANPDQQWTLLDKNSKKTRFLTQVVAELQLPNVAVIHQSCTDFHPAECFDSILSRAFGTIPLFVESTAHLLCPNGQFIAMKGKYPQTELHDVPKRFIIQTVTKVDIVGMDIERHVIQIGIKNESSSPLPLLQQKALEERGRSK